MPSLVGSGTTAALTIGTETTLQDTSAAGVYVLQVDLSNMAVGDVSVLRLRAITLAGDSVPGAIVYEAIFSDAQAQPIAISVPIPTELATSGAIRSTITQIVGTGRTFKWKLLAL